MSEATLNKIVNKLKTEHNADAVDVNHQGDEVAYITLEFNEDFSRYFSVKYGVIAEIE